MTSTDSLITYFDEDEIKHIDLPKRFTFPFYYEPHPLTRLAVEQLQDYLTHSAPEGHNFGLSNDQEGLVIGKMFGVLVVKDTHGKIGYLSAFSGKLAGSNLHPKFVPPVFDLLVENNFFLQEEEVLNALTREIQTKEQNPVIHSLTADLQQITKKYEQDLLELREKISQNKFIRRQRRAKEKEELSADAYEQLCIDLGKESVTDKRKLAHFIQEWEARIEQIKKPLDILLSEIQALKQLRKEKSSALQTAIFERYTFLNQAGKEKSLGAIFQETIYQKPPAGAGECATPKLLQYAFLKGYEPLAMAEFWWGAPPKSEIRLHKNYYPACTGKCKPILQHMLDGILLDENPFQAQQNTEINLTILYEDAGFIVVYKPAELLSVPGLVSEDSVYSRLQKEFGIAEPLIIHRLDMPTSGVMVVAKTKQAHKHIQKQFLNRTVEKRYTALLSKRIDGEEGEITLPLRGDFDDRPRQLVCFEHGKPAHTRWKVVEKGEHTTRVHFWPLTGRTHQLRMHAAHPLGLHAPIVGDDLYGKPANRLHLHAAFLAITHPFTKERMVFEIPDPF